MSLLTLHCLGGMPPLYVVCVYFSAISACTTCCHSPWTRSSCPARSGSPAWTCTPLVTTSSWAATTRRWCGLTWSCLPNRSRCCGTTRKRCGRCNTTRRTRSWPPLAMMVLCTCCTPRCSAISCRHVLAQLCGCGCGCGCICACATPLVPELTHCGWPLQNPLIVPVKVLRAHKVTADHLGILSCMWHPTQPWLFTAGADHGVKLFQNIP